MGNVTSQVMEFTPTSNQWLEEFFQRAGHALDIDTMEKKMRQAFTTKDLNVIAETLSDLAMSALTAICSNKELFKALLRAPTLALSEGEISNLANRPNVLALASLVMSLSNFGIAAISWNTVPARGFLKVKGHGYKWNVERTPDRIWGDNKETTRISVSMTHLSGTNCDGSVVWFDPQGNGEIQLIGEAPYGGWHTSRVKHFIHTTTHKAEVLFRTSHEAGEATVKMDIMNPKEELKDSIMATEYVNIIILEPGVSLLTVYTQGAPDYEVWGYTVEDPQRSPGSIPAVDEVDCFYLGSGTSNTSSFDVGSYRSILVGTRLGVLLDAIRFPDDRYLQVEWKDPSTGPGGWIWNEEFGISNLHRPYPCRNGELLDEDAPNNLDYHYDPYGGIHPGNPYGSLSLDTNRIMGPPDDDVDEMGLRAECNGQVVNRLKGEFFFVNPRYIEE